jgi:hypothetical protein
MLKKDWGVLTAVVRIILPGLSEKQMGGYDVSELKELWAAKQDGWIAR